jgi:translation initiation factor IF-2
MDLTSKPTEIAEGTIIEASVDKRLGAVSTALVQHGNLQVGDIVLAGSAWGKVRKLLSDQGKELKLAGPSTPVQIVGLSSVPNAGDSFVVVENEENARSLAEARQRISRQTAGSMSTANILAQATGLAGGTFDGREILKIPIVLKADVAGSVEALISSIQALEVSDTETVCKIDIVSASVGDITFSDVAIAAAAKAKIIAFNVGPGQNVMDAARSSNVAMEFYTVVYDALDNLEKVVQTTFSPPPPGLLLGKAEIKKSFKLGKLGYVAGCKVLEGVIRQDSKVRVLRGKRNQIYLGTLESLRVGKESVSEVPNGSDCGMHFVDFQDFAEGDIIESFANA